MNCLDIYAIRHLLLLHHHLGRPSSPCLQVPVISNWVIPSQEEYEGKVEATGHKSWVAAARSRIQGPLKCHYFTIVRRRTKRRSWEDDSPST